MCFFRGFGLSSGEGFGLSSGEASVLGSLGGYTGSRVSVANGVAVIRREVSAVLRNNIYLAAAPRLYFF